MFSNIRTLTDTLSRMELPELHDYATLHKNDPYIVIMALSIANQKKQADIAEKGQDGMQPQPKVVDQELAQMLAPPPQQMAPPPQQMAPPPQQMAPPPQQALPEDSGIGQLPAPNMQNMAEGGIVAFDDGGSVPSFAGPAGSYVNPLAEYLKQRGITHQEFLAKTGPEQQQIRAEARVAATASAVPPRFHDTAVYAAQTEAAATHSRLAAYLKQLGITTQEFLAKTGPEQQQIRAQASVAIPETPPPAVPVAQAEAAAAHSKAYKTGVGAAKLIRRFGLPGALASAIPDMGTYKIDPDIDTSAYGTYNYLKEGELGKAGKSLAKGLPEAALDAGLSLTNMADVFIPGDAPLSTWYDRKVRELIPPIRYDPKTATLYDPNTATRKDKFVDAPPVVAPPPVVSPPTADAVVAGIDKLLKGSKTGGSGRYVVTAPQLAAATPKAMADRLAAAMGPNPTESPFAAQQEKLNKATIASRQKYAADLEKQFTEQGEAFTETLANLTSKEARVKTMEDNQLGMSMFEAGLAMMAGESPYALVNIGKGAQVGTKKYMEIQDKVEAARDKIDDAKMKIHEFRRNEANMNAREKRLARKDVDDAVSTGAQASLNLMRENFNLAHAQGLAFVTNSFAIDRFNIEQKTAYANMDNQRAIEGNKTRMHLELAKLEAAYRASNPAAGTLKFYKAFSHEGDAIKGLEAYYNAVGGTKSDAALIAPYLNHPEKLAALEAVDPVLAAQIKQKIKMRLLQPENISKDDPRYLQ